jgi:hypothetical protein
MACSVKQVLMDWMCAGAGDLLVRVMPCAMPRGPLPLILVACAGACNGWRNAPEAMQPERFRPAATNAVENCFHGAEVRFDCDEAPCVVAVRPPVPGAKLDLSCPEWRAVMSADAQAGRNGPLWMFEARPECHGVKAWAPIWPEIDSASLGRRLFDRATALVEPGWCTPPPP